MADEDGGKKKRLGRGLAALIGEVGTEPPADPRPPRDTRRVLGFALETCWEGRNRRLHPNAFGVARM